MVVTCLPGARLCPLLGYHGSLWGLWSSHPESTTLSQADPSWPLSATERNHSQIWMNHGAPGGVCTIWPEGASNPFQVSSLRRVGPGDSVYVSFVRARGATVQGWQGRARPSSWSSASILRPHPRAQAPCLWSGKAGGTQTPTSRETDRQMPRTHGAAKPGDHEAGHKHAANRGQQPWTVTLFLGVCVYRITSVCDAEKQRNRKVSFSHVNRTCSGERGHSSRAGGASPQPCRHS